MADVLRWPGAGRLLRWRHARTALQAALLAAAAIVVLHGLTGPPIAGANLATVLVWVHYRGLLVVALLAAGNLFCTGCPFILVRDLARRLRRPTVHWPARLRGKGVALALFAAVLLGYELFDWWALPRATALLVLAYFAAALAIDLTFTGASFCKHVCPVGQFNFVASTVSPLELRVRSQATCATCRTTDCISGRRDTAPASLPAPAFAASTAIAPSPTRGPIVQRGCELGLFLPQKVGNLDCTFCLDCVQACPHDNVALATRVPGAELADPGRRSGIGRLAARPDLALLSLLFVFGALLNAFAMTAPAAALGERLGARSEALAVIGLFAAGLIAVPAALVGGAAAATRWLTGAEAPVARVALPFVHALVPLGVGVWAAHYAFHFFTGALVVVPVAQAAAADVAGATILGEPLWGWTGLAPGLVLPMQAGAILLGAMGSLAVATLVARDAHPHSPGRAAAPWAVVTVAVSAAAMWTMTQPMAMRGVGIGG